MAQAHSQRSVLRFFAARMWQHKYKCLAMAFLNVLWGFGEAYTPYLLKLVVDTLHSYGDQRAAGASLVWWFLGGIVGLMLAKHFVQRVTDILTEGYIGPIIQGDIRMSMISYAMGHSYDYYQRNLTGSVANKINQVAESFQRMYEGLEHWIVPVMWSFLFSIIILWQTHPMCAVLVMVWLVVSIGLSSWLSVYGIDYSRKHARTVNLLIGNIVNVLQNIFTVKMFARNKRELEYLGSLQRKEIDAVCTLEWFLLRVRVALSLTCIGLLAGLIVFLLHAWQQGVITVGDVTFVLTTCFNMFNTIWWISSHSAKLYKEYGIASQAYEVMSEPHQIVDTENAGKIKVTKGEIVFDKVDFRYKGNAAIFKKLSTTIRAGEKIGLVGYSGSGKTSFVHLIMRFFDLKSGSIRIDGQDISQVTQNSLRRQIALIPQEPMMFARPVKENLAYGRPDASDREMTRAVRQAHADQFIRKLPARYETVLGERGTNLSGGQRQRLAIARAILKDAPILILDEATSALDSITEKHIQESLEDLMKNRTAIVIAHRLSTLQNMDRLLVFENGSIIEEGTHKELVSKKDGYYARLWKMQVGGVIPDKSE